MLGASGGFLKKVFKAPLKAAGAVAGGVKKMGGAIGVPVPGPKKPKEPKSAFGKAVMAKKNAMAGKGV